MLLGGRRKQQPTIDGGAAKVMDGQDKRDRTATGKGWR